MSIFANSNDKLEAVAQTIRDSGGTIVGRTRLQKTLYLLSIAGYEVPFEFEYKHYGPFSDQLAEAATVGAAFGSFVEEQKSTSWGGSYFLYAAQGSPSNDGDRVALTKIASSADAIALELAATAVYLSLNGFNGEPWQETSRRKPDKIVNGKIEAAQKLYSRLRELRTPKPLPILAA